MDAILTDDVTEESLIETMGTEHAAHRISARQFQQKAHSANGANIRCIMEACVRAVRRNNKPPFAQTTSYIIDTIIQTQFSVRLSIKTAIESIVNTWLNTFTYHTYFSLK